MQTDAISQLDRYIRSRYPVIVLVSHEEARVERELISLLKARKRRLYTWTITDGMKYQRFDPKDNGIAISPDATKDPAEALRAAIGFPRAEEYPTVFLMKDIHGYLGDPVLVRLLRDLVAAFEVGKNTLILLSPEFRVPSDLEKSVVMIDWPLPDVDQLAKILTGVEKKLVDEAPVTLNGNRPQVVQAMRGLTAFEAESVLLSAVVATGELGEGVIPYIIREKRQIIRKSGVLEFYEETATMDQVGGLQNLKRYARLKRATFSERARDYGVEPAKGVILLGIPGVGKSLSAKAIAGGELPLLRLDIGAVMGSLVGQSEANIRNALRTVEAVAPAVLWIDEIEKALGDQGGEADGGTTQRVFGTLLTWMQETKAPVYVVATANDIRSLKPELLRRFDDILFVDLPCHEDRLDVLLIHLLKRGQDQSRFDLDAVARASWGLTGAEIEKAVKAALEQAFIEERELTTNDLVTAAKAIIPIASTMKEQIEDLRTWARNRAIPAADPIEDFEEARGTVGRMIEL